jgi:hypothetical protein
MSTKPDKAKKTQRKTAKRNHTGNDATLSAEALATVAGGVNATEIKGLEEAGRAVGEAAHDAGTFARVKRVGSRVAGYASTGSMVLYAGELGQ